MTDLLLKIDGTLTASIPLLIKLSLIKCVLASVLRRSLRTGLNNLYWVVSKIIAAELHTQQIHNHSLWILRQVIDLARYEILSEILTQK